METHFKLTIDEKTGKPLIEFKHHDKDTHLYQKLLGVFVKQAMEKGLEIDSPSGMISDKESYEIYQIKIKE